MWSRISSRSLIRKRARDGNLVSSESSTSRRMIMFMIVLVLGWSNFLPVVASILQSASKSSSSGNRTVCAANSCLSPSLLINSSPSKWKMHSCTTFCYICHSQQNQSRRNDTIRYVANEI